LTEQAFQSNFQAFNKPTAQAMLVFMQRLKIFTILIAFLNIFIVCRVVRDIQISAGELFQITLSLQTFMDVSEDFFKINLNVRLIKL
jgi:hypothetical protein